MAKKNVEVNVPYYQDKRLVDIEGEVWKDIPGLEGYGMISNLGRVKRLAYESVNKLGRVTTFEERIQTQKIHSNFNAFKQDYKVRLQTRIQLDNFCHVISVARIVYYCFVAKFDLSDLSAYVSYKDGNGLNVLPNNLFLTDHSGLQQQIMKAGRKDLHFGHSEENQERFSRLGREVSRKPVSQYDMEGNLVAVHNSMGDAAKTAGITVSAVSAVARKRKGLLTAGGFIWRLSSGKRTIPVKRIHQAIRATKGFPVSRYSLEGRKVSTYDNITEAAKAVAVDRKAISDAINGRILVTAGSIWRKGEAEQIDVNKEKTSLSLRKGYTISRYDENGVKQATYFSSKAAAAAIGVSVERVNAMAIRDDLLLDNAIWRYGEAQHLPTAELNQVKKNLKMGKPREITQFDLKGQWINCFASISAASQLTGIAATVITGCINGHKATGGGFLWRRGKGNANLILPEMPRRLGSKFRKEVSQFDKNGQLIRHFSSIKEAARSLGIRPTTISAVLRKNGITAGGFIWKIKRQTKRF